MTSANPGGIGGIIGGTSNTSSGTLNLGGIIVGGQTQTSLPVDNTGMTSIWNGPTGMSAADTQAFWNTQIWFDTGHGTSQTAVPDDNPRNKHNINTPDSFDINASAQDIMKQYAAMSQNDPTGFAALQKELQAAGFYGSSSSVYGGWNAQTETALADSMAQYLKVSKGAGVGLSFTQFLANQANANIALNGNTPGGGSGGGMSTPILADTDTLTRYAQMAAKNALGRALSPDELNKFINEFHSQQVQSYQDAANHNGLSAAKDDPRSSAIGFVTKNNPQEFQQNQVAGYTDAFLNMFLPNGSNAPSPSVDPTAIGY